jgi:deltex-like protein
MRGEVPIDVVIMSKCTDHCFHRECLEMQMKDQDNLRCAVCWQIYGVLSGEMPPGEMHWKLYPKTTKLHCKGYQDFGVWEISYSFPDGKLKDGKRYTGTFRIAFLPDNPQGREVLALLIKAFERRLTFIVGTSVTTGR